MSPASPREFVCPAQHADRLDRSIAAFLPDVSRSLARKLIDVGSVYVDGRRCRVSSRTVYAGNRIRLETLTLPEVGTEVPLTVLFADEHLVAIDKPAGMASLPGRNSASDSAIVLLARQLRAGEPSGAPLLPVHRLDLPTSGILMFARSRLAASALGDAFAANVVTKTYMAIVDGCPHPTTGIVDAPLRKVGNRTVLARDGQQAITEWSVAEAGGARSLVEVRPRTGRMHQIRVHLASIGHPVVGDAKYGGSEGPRLMLHARRLQLVHPATGQPLEIESPLPAHLTLAALDVGAANGDTHGHSSS